MPQEWAPAAGPCQSCPGGQPGGGQAGQRKGHTLHWTSGLSLLPRSGSLKGSQKGTTTGMLRLECWDVLLLGVGIERSNVGSNGLSFFGSFIHSFIQPVFLGLHCGPSPGLRAGESAVKGTVQWLGSWT